MRNIRAVIWDFGGVITSSPFEAFARFEAKRGLPKDFIRTINATNPDTNAWARLERDEIDPQNFDHAFRQEAEKHGHSIGGSEILPLLAGTVRPEMVALLHDLKADSYRLGCITNNIKIGRGSGMARSAAQATQVRDVMALFDHVIESARVGLRKPDPKIYQMACAALDCPPATCAFLDDLGVNLKPARALGMHTIKVVTPEQAIADLTALLAQNA